MKNLKFLAMMFAAALSFAACEGGEEEIIDGELTLKATPTMILCDGEYASKLDVRLGSKKITSGVQFFDEDNNPLEITNMEFTTTEAGNHVIWAAYGDKFSNDVTIKAVVEFPAVTEIPADPNPNSTSFVRKVLLTQYTGTECPWCPFMINRIYGMPKALFNKCVWTAAHRFYPEYDPAGLDGAALEYTMAVEGFPSLAVDMHSVTGDYRAQGIVNGMVQSAIDREPAKAGIAACVAYSPASRMVSVKAEVKAAVTDNYRIGAWLLEDNIHGEQKNNGATGYDYNTHHNAIRIADSKVTSSDYTGYYLGEIKAGEKKIYEFNPVNMTLNSAWKAENCHVVIFITTEGEMGTGTLNTWFVNNVIDCPLNSAVEYQYK